MLMANVTDESLGHGDYRAYKTHIINTQQPPPDTCVTFSLTAWMM